MAQKVRLVVWLDNDQLQPVDAMKRLAEVGRALRTNELQFNPKWIVADIEELAHADLTLEDVVDIYNKNPFDEFEAFGGDVPRG